MLLPRMGRRTWQAHPLEKHPAIIFCPAFRGRFRALKTASESPWNWDFAAPWKTRTSPSGTSISRKRGSFPSSPEGTRARQSEVGLIGREGMTGITRRHGQRSFSASVLHPGCRPGPCP